MIHITSGECDDCRSGPTEMIQSPNSIQVMIVSIINAKRVQWRVGMHKTKLEVMIFFGEQTFAKSHFFTFRMISSPQNCQTFTINVFWMTKQLEYFKINGLEQEIYQNPFPKRDFLIA